MSANDKPDDDKVQQDGSNTNTNDKPKLFLSNNFYNYRSGKLGVSRDTEKTQSNNEDDTNESILSSERSSVRDHFLAPFTDNSPEKDDLTSDASSRTYPTKNNTSSVFTDYERGTTVDAFSKIFMKQMGDAISSGKVSKAWNSHDDNSNGMSWLTTDYSKIIIDSDNEKKEKLLEINAKDYTAERTMIQPHLTPFIWGMSCSAITLFSLRFGKWYQSRRLGNNLFVRKSNHEGIVSKSKDKKSIQDLRWNTPKDYGTYHTTSSNPMEVQTKNTLDNLLSLPVDISISILFGMSTSIFLTQRQQLLNDLASAPLLSGNSILSEELCQPFTNEMERINRGYYTYSIGSNPEDDSSVKNVIPFRELWRDDNLGEFDSLRSIRQFVINCQKRDLRSKQKEDEDISDEI
eukprot:scaffold26080_cov43-Cyclotella_meneghiniana.AAC.6